MQCHLDSNIYMYLMLCGVFFLSAQHSSHVRILLPSIRELASPLITISQPLRNLTEDGRSESLIPQPYTMCPENKEYFHISTPIHRNATECPHSGYFDPGHSSRKPAEMWIIRYGHFDELSTFPLIPWGSFSSLWAVRFC